MVCWSIVQAAVWKARGPKETRNMDNYGVVGSIISVIEYYVLRVDQL
jgi:hypothetical protein